MDKSKDLGKDTLIDKLKTISALYKNVKTIECEMDTFEPEDLYQREVLVPEFPPLLPDEGAPQQDCEFWKHRLNHTDTDALEVAEIAHRKTYSPKKPEEPKKEAFVKKEDHALTAKRLKLKHCSYITAAICVFFILGAIFGVDKRTLDTLPTILGIAALCAAATAFLRFKEKGVKKAIDDTLLEALLIHDQRHEEAMAEYSQKMKAYEADKAAYENTLQAFLENYRSWRDIYISSAEEEARIQELLEQNRQAAVHKIYEEKLLPAVAALNEANDLVAKEYLPALDVIIDLLAHGRADSLKEAINLYEELLYRERQLQLQREQELHRQREEELRRQAEERRHREDMDFRKKQEKQRKSEEEDRQRKEAEQQILRAAQEENAANMAMRDAKSRCHWCKNWKECAIRSSPPLNCPAFRPGSTRQI